MSRARLESSVFVLALGCSTASAPSPRAAPARGPAPPVSVTAAPAPPLEPDTFRLQAERLIAQLEALRSVRLVGTDDGPVPDFRVEASDGTELDSSELIGHRPFVVAFFATWCGACEQKLMTLRNALDQAGDMLVIPVSFDGPGSRGRVSAYLRALGIAEPAVPASEHPLLVLSYNPFDTIPLLVIVGRNGGLVDYQLGNELAHDRRLVASLKLAHIIPPLAKPSAPTSLRNEESP